MILGALLDLGVPRAVVDAALEQVGVGADRLTVARVVKRGIAAVDVKVRVDPEPAHDHHAHDHHAHDHHAHDHHAHDHHVAHAEIAARIAAAGLAPEVARRSLATFDWLARAESAVHQIPVDRVRFHEVGAIDSIVDAVGAAAALSYLDPIAVSAAPVAVGHGVASAAHGRLPVPAPATVEILRAAGGQMVDGGVARELCTPTGAAILAASVDRWGAPPAMTPLAIGYGAGDADLDDRANVVRALLGAPAGAAERAGDEVYRVEANLDDMSPELCEHAAAALFDRGALDVWWTPIAMKKSRPAVLLSALVPAGARDAVVDAILRETTTIGVRFDQVERRILDRGQRVVATPYGELPIKLAWMGGEVVNAAPEYEPCRRAAAAHGVPLKQVYAAVLAAYHRG
jgi:hypothetical protein